MVLVVPDSLERVPDVTDNHRMTDCLLHSPVPHRAGMTEELVPEGALEAEAAPLNKDLPCRGA